MPNCLKWGRSLTCLVCLSSIAFAQDVSGVKIEKIAERLRYAEGPAWSAEGFLLFSDAVANKLYRFVPGKGNSELRDVPGGPMGNAYDSQGRLYTCEFRQRRLIRTLKNGKTEILAERFEGKRLNAPNDVAIRRDGQIYFTDPAFGNQEDTRELDFNGVFHLAPKGELEVVAKFQTRPNGIAVAPNGRTLYVTDSDAHLIRAWDLDRSGTAANDRVLVSKIPGIPDGIRTDEKGNVYVAAKDLYVYSPEGRLLSKYELPETPTNLSFGDGDLKSIYVTTRTSVFRIRLGAKGAY